MKLERLNGHLFRSLDLKEQSQAIAGSHPTNILTAVMTFVGSPPSTDWKVDATVTDN